MRSVSGKEAVAGDQLGDGEATRKKPEFVEETEESFSLRAFGRAEIQRFRSSIPVPRQDPATTLEVPERSP